MKIEAYNIEDFNREYYKNYNYDIKDIYEIVIELKTDYTFWQELVGEESDKQINNFLIKNNQEIDKDKVRITSLFHPKYGHIKMC